ncbi:MAG: class II aldolase/adducin family protein [bacterium]|nr:class II aldolase/adducin family protein [bacterium]
MPELYRVKRAIIEIGRRMYARGMVAANDGNISVRLGGGLFAVTAAGVSKGFLTPDDVVVIDESGRKIEGGGRPTSEAKLHLFAYSRRPDVGAVCHAHPPFATEELAHSIEEHLGGADAFLLANHGVLTLGADLTQAYHRLETVEHYAKIAWLALSLGGATPLPEGELDRLWCISKGLSPDCRKPGWESSKE